MHLVMVLAAAIGLLAGPGAMAQVTLTHVHGLAYSPDGLELMIPSHHGLAVYRGGKWSKAPGPQHDYMGFAGTGSALYSSGHPAPGANLVNPFGLIRSRDGGKTWDKLGLEGETDFHLLAAGWGTNAIYVWNPHPSSRLRRPGLHYTLDDGKAWKPAKAAGLAGEPIALAVHPKEPKRMAIGTSEGVFESADSGDSFNRVAPGPGTAVLFDLDGKRLWHAGVDRQARLGWTPVGGGPHAQVTLPPLVEDAVAYMAQNPRRRDEYAIATFKRSVFLSRDRGASWLQIADAGKAR
jgi:hypothetical protein